MASTTTSARIRLGDPGALVAAVPHLLGFVPADSLVAIGLRGRRRTICLTVRADLGDVTEPGWVLAILAQLRRAGGDAAAFVLVGPAAPGGPPAPGAAAPGPAAQDAAPPPGWDVLPHRAVADMALAVCDAQELPVLDVLWADRGRWWSYLCDDRRCCPPEGSAVHPDAAAELAAELALAGRGVLPDRTALERTVASSVPPGAPVAAFRAALTPVLGEVGAALRRGVRTPFDFADAALQAAVEQCDPGGAGIPHEESVRLIAFLRMHCLRADGLQWLGGDRHDAAQALWMQLTRDAPTPWGSVPATLLALYAYTRGDGALARVAVDRALSDDRDDPRALAVSALLDRGVPPEDVARCARRMVRQATAGASRQPRRRRR
jgi:hypothetical protein